MLFALVRRLIEMTRKHTQVSGWSGAAALHAAENGSKAVVYKGMMDCFAKTVKEEGFFALFKVGVVRKAASQTCAHITRHVYCCCAETQRERTALSFLCSRA